MGNLIFTDKAWEDYIFWQTYDKKTVRRINQILKDIDRNGYQGIGMPEALKGDLSGFWSRRIDDCNRIVYRIVYGAVEIVQLRGHYDDK